jgi:YVTN family beta-propeller protein
LPQRSTRKSGLRHTGSKKYATLSRKLPIVGVSHLAARKLTKRGDNWKRDANQDYRDEFFGVLNKSRCRKNGASNDVSVVDVKSRKEMRRIKVGDGPWGIAIVSAAK